MMGDACVSSNRIDQVLIPSRANPLSAFDSPSDSHENKESSSSSSSSSPGSSSSSSSSSSSFSSCSHPPPHRGFLGHAVTSKVIERWGSKWYRVSAAEMQGYRSYMEDFHAVRLRLSPEHDDTALFGVFDGHSGALASAFLAQHLPAHLAAFTQPSDPEQVRIGVLEVDSEICSNKHARKTGSTAVFALVAPLEFSSDSNKVEAPKKYEITIANVGDSLGVLLSKEGRLKFATKPHKPTDPDERARIQQAGGLVQRGRVDGSLAMSRSMGDAKYKSDSRSKNFDESSMMSLVRSKVSSEADVSVIEAESGDFLLLCSDGVADEFDDAQLEKWVRSELQQASDQKGVDPARVVSQLLNEALRLGSTDNMSALLVAFTPGIDYQHPYENIVPKIETATNDLSSASASTATATPAAVKKLIAGQSCIESECIHNDNDEISWMEFIPGPIKQFESCPHFKQSYIEFAKRHGYAAVFDNDGAIVSLQKVRLHPPDKSVQEQQHMRVEFEESSSKTRAERKRDRANPQLHENGEDHEDDDVPSVHPQVLKIRLVDDNHKCPHLGDGKETAAANVNKRKIAISV